MGDSISPSIYVSAHSTHSPCSRGHGGNSSPGLDYRTGKGRRRHGFWDERGKGGYGMGDCLGGRRGTGGGLVGRENGIGGG